MAGKDVMPTNSLVHMYIQLISSSLPRPMRGPEQTDRIMRVEVEIAGRKIYAESSDPNVEGTRCISWINDVERDIPEDGRGAVR